MEDARTEYGLPKIWLILAHAYMADTRLSSSSPPRAFGEPGNVARGNTAYGSNMRRYISIFFFVIKV